MNREQRGQLNFNWRREAILLAQALAEAILVVPWSLALLPGGRSIMPALAVGACLSLSLGALYLTRAMDAARIPTLIQRGVILIGMVGATALALNVAVFTAPYLANWDWLRSPSRHVLGLAQLLPEVVIATMGVAWLCWRGLQLADKLPSLTDVANSFQIGVVVMSLLVVISADPDLTIFVPAYFFCQLLAVSLTRVEMIARERGGKRPAFSGWWLAVLTGSTGAVVLIASLVSAILLGIGPDKLWTRLWPFLSILAAPVAVILLVLAGLLGILLEPFLRRLQGWLATLAGRFPELASNQDNPLEKLNQAETTSRIIQYVEIVVVILIVLAVLVTVARSIGHRQQQSEDEDELHESVWSSNALLRKLRQQLQNRLAQLRNLAGLAGRFGTDGLFAALTIRRIYAQTVRLAMSRGYPRPAARTPYEHLATLGQAFPGCESELLQLTEAYVGVHYGELPEHADALAEIRAAFERIKMTQKPASIEN